LTLALQCSIESKLLSFGEETSRQTHTHTYVNRSSVNVFITTINNRVAEARTWTIKYFNDASVLYLFLTLDISGMEYIRLISRPIHAPNHELEATDTDTHPTKVITKRILDELLGIREENVILCLWGMKPLVYLAYFSTLKLVHYILVYGARWLLMLDGDSLILLGVKYIYIYIYIYTYTHPHTHIHTLRYLFFCINIYC
jgi:hypothetical protein